MGWKGETYAGRSEFTYNPEQNNVRQSLAPIPNLNFMLSFGIFFCIINMELCLFFRPNTEGLVIAMNYNKLWKLLIDRGLMKKDLREMADLSSNVIAKMRKGGDVSTEVLRKNAKALDCKVEDIVDFEE